MLAFKTGKVIKDKFLFNATPRFNIFIIYQIIGRKSLGLCQKKTKKLTFFRLKYVY